MAETLTDSVTIVTGAASGIGRACARALFAAGSRVAAVDVNEAGLADLAGELAALDPARAAEQLLTLRLSVSSEADMTAMAEQTRARFGRIDALVAAAGILRVGGQLKTLADTPLAEWNAVIDTNLTGTFLSNQAVLPAMMEQRKGDIVNVSSTSGRQGRPFDGAYCSSKFGIIGLSESLSEEVSSYGIRVQTLLPDAVETPLWDQNGPAGLKPTHFLPAARVAEIVVYLLSLPRDAMLLNPVVAPFKSRRQRKGKG